MNDLDLMEAMNNIDLSKVETSFPLLDSGIVTVQVAKCEYKKDDKEDAKPYCLIELNLVEPWKTVKFDGNESKPVLPGGRGSVITERVYVGTYEDKKTGETKWYGVDTLAKFREAVYGKAAEGVRFQPAEMLGQTLQVRLQFDPAPKGKDGQTYGPRTSVAAYIKKKS